MKKNLGDSFIQNRRMTEELKLNESFASENPEYNNRPVERKRIFSNFVQMNFSARKEQDSDDLDKSVWDQKKSWKDRKKEAIESLKDKNDLCYIAYNGSYNQFKEKILDILYPDKNISYQEKERKLNDLFEQSKSEIIKADLDKIEPERENNFKFGANEHALTPLVFAIWGFIEYENKPDRVKCLDLLLKIFACNIEIHVKDLSKELGLLYIHYLDRTNTMLGNNKILEVIIKKDLLVSLEYIIEYFVENQLPLIDFLRNKAENSNILIFAITNESLESVTILFEKINNFNDEDFKLFTDDIETEFSKIFLTNSGLLKIFLDKLMVTEKNKQKVRVNKAELPLITYVNNIELKDMKKDNIYEYNIDKNKYKYKETKPDTVKILNTLIRLPSINGSPSSYEFMVNLVLNSSCEIYKSKIIQYYIKKKWESLWDRIFLQSLLLWSNLLFVILWIWNQNFWYVVYLIIINLILLVFEGGQMRSLGIRKYFGIIEFYPLLYISFWGLAIYHYFFSTNSIITFGICCSVYFLIQIKKYKQRSEKFINRKSSTEQIIKEKFATEKFITEIVFFGILLLLILIRSIDASESVFIAYFILQGVILGISMCISELKRRISFLDCFIILAHFRVFCLIDYAVQGTKDSVLVSQITSYAISYFVFSIYLLFRKRNIDVFIFFIFMIIFTTFAILFYFVHYTSIKACFYIFYLIILLLEIFLAIEILDEKITEVKYESPKTAFILAKVIKYGVPHMILILFAISFYSDRENLYYFIVYLSLELVLKFVKSRNFFYKLSGNVFSFVFNWNTMDMIRILVFFIWVVFWIISEPSNSLIWGLTLMSVIRGLTAFRCFNGTRYYVRLIFNCIVDIKAFLIILCYSTLGFGLIKAVHENDVKINSLSFKDFIISSINQDFGSGDPVTDWEFEYLIYIFTCLINLIIILNLLINILGNSFAAFNETSVENDYMEMAEVIFEIENTMFYRRKFQNSKNELGYLLVWDHWVNESPEEASLETIYAKISNVEEKLEKFLSRQ
jgi:hypothetical protein